MLMHQAKGVKYFMNLKDVHAFENRCVLRLFQKIRICASKGRLAPVVPIFQPGVGCSLRNITLPDHGKI